MDAIKDTMQRWGTALKTPRAKRRIYVGLCLLLVAWFVFRFVMVGVENRRMVFNPMRDAADRGIPVQVINVSTTTGVLREPISVKDNRATVAAARVGHFQPGQQVGDGVITSVSRQIDLDTGMYTVRTRGVADGLHFAQYQGNGYFIPTEAIDDNHVFVVDGDRAVRRAVVVARQDASQALVTDGLQAGDRVIVSRVRDGQKVRVQQ